MTVPGVLPAGQSMNGQEFDFKAYARHRTQNPNFIMVEFGHGLRPVAYRQPAGFTGQRAYVGVEAGLREAKLHARAQLGVLQAKYPDENITYIDQDLNKNGNRVERILSRLMRPIGFVGLYDPSTILPDGAADEVFLSNVFGDPQVANSKVRTQRLLDEVSRVTAEKGMVVIRETITPTVAQASLTGAALQNAGLQTAGSYTQEDQCWDHLEGVYGAGRGYYRLTNFYQFLTKTAGV